MESRESRAAAEAQLATLQAQRAALAERVVQPWWHDVAAGLLLFGLLASSVIEPSWARALVTLAFAAGMGGLAWTYWRRTGVWAYPDRTVWLTWVPLAVVVLVPAYVLADGSDRAWVMPAAGAVLGLALALLGRHWSRRWAAELRSAS
jgi:hypothetical protein